MSEVVDFTKHRRADVLSALEELLEEARAGNIVSLAAVVLTKDEHVGVHYTPEGHWLKLAGAVTQLQHAVMADPEEWG